MIERVVIKNYKCIKNANIVFNKFKNIIVGNKWCRKIHTDGSCISCLRVRSKQV